MFFKITSGFSLQKLNSAARYDLNGRETVNILRLLKVCKTRIFILSEYFTL